MAHEAFEENRHPEFAEGNLVRMTHGARVMAWRLQGRAEEIADDLRPLVPEYAPGDEILLTLLCTVLARIEKAAQWVEAQESIVSKTGKPVAVLKDLASWEGSATRMLAQLGLTPDSRRRSRQSEGTAALAEYLARKEAGE